MKTTDLAIKVFLLYVVVGTIGKPVGSVFETIVYSVVSRSAYMETMFGFAIGLAVFTICAIAAQGLFLLPTMLRKIGL